MIDKILRVSVALIFSVSSVVIVGAYLLMF